MADVCLWLGGGQSNAVSLSQDLAICATQATAGDPNAPSNKGCTVNHNGQRIQQWTDELGVRGIYWDQDIAFWDQCIQEVIDAGDTPIIKGFGWMQGEANTNPLYDPLLYEQQLTVLITDLYNHFATAWQLYVDPNFKMGIVLTGACLDTMPVERDPGIWIVRTAQIAVGNALPFACWSESWDSPRCPDIWHPSADGRKAFASALFSAMTTDRWICI